MFPRFFFHWMTQRTAAIYSIVQISKRTATSGFVLNSWRLSLSRFWEDFIPLIFNEFLFAMRYRNFTVKRLGPQFQKSDLAENVDKLSCARTVELLQEHCAKLKNWQNVSQEQTRNMCMKKIYNLSIGQRCGKFGMGTGVLQFNQSRFQARMS